MDLTLSERERLVHSQARDMLEREVPLSLVAEVEEASRFPDEIWRKIGSQGWFGLAIPEKSGGSGGTLLEWALVLEEMGKVASPGPVVEQSAAAVYLSNISELPLSLPLSQVINGSIVLSVGLEDRSDQAVRADASYILTGEKILVPYAQHAEGILVSAQLSDVGSGYLSVARDAESIRVNATKTMSGGQHASVRMDGVPASFLGGANPELLANLHDIYVLGRDAYCVGLLGRMLEISVSYARDRVQFGRPIGSFQAIQHRCADMALAIYGAQILVYQSAWLGMRQASCERELAMCHAYVRDAAGEAVMHAHQIHGAIGFTAEYPLQLFSRRAKAYQHSLGSATSWREVVASRMQD